MRFMCVCAMGSRHEASKKVRRNATGKAECLKPGSQFLASSRWAATVSRPDIQKIAGALHGQHETKGIFITNVGFFERCERLRFEDRQQDRADRWIEVG
jgi:restriction system protein